ncbi:MAG TPA: FHA domain-containing protein, partial [Segeticoccus sp.]|nr:FHA domain-containing protein [Segeticoccus sp.]
MQLRITVVDEGTGTQADLEVGCAPGTDLARFASALPVGCAPAGCADGSWWIGAVELADTTVVGRPPLLDGAVLTHRCAPHPALAASDTPALLELHVLEGPDCGTVHPLPPGEHRIGRSRGTVRIRDPDLSRAHCELHVSHDQVTVRDLDSTNGTLLDGARLTASHPWQPGQRLRIGSTTLLLRVPQEPRASVTADGAGHLRLHRGPRLHQSVPAPTIGMPAEPAAAHRQRLPLAMVVLPLAVSAVLAAVLHSTTMLLFGLLGPAMLLSSWISDRRGGRASNRQQQREYRCALDRFSEQRDEALRLELRARRASAPDPADLAAQVRRTGARLWQRRLDDPDFLSLRLGTGTVGASLAVHPAGGNVRAEHPLLADAPVTVNLPEVGVLGVGGPREAVLGCVRSLVGQLVGWHSPQDLALVLLTPDDDRAASRRHDW